MSFAFELHFDEQTESAIRATWAALGDLGCDTRRNGFAPHVTLAIASRFRPTLARELRTFAQAYRPFPVTLDAVATFPSGVIFYRPAASEDLVAMHRAFHRRFSALPAAPNSHLYRPERWQPHCTLAMRTPREFRIDRIAAAPMPPMPPPGSFERLRVVEYPRLELRFDCPLGDAERLW